MGVWRRREKVESNEDSVLWLGVDWTPRADTDRGGPTRIRKRKINIVSERSHFKEYVGVGAEAIYIYGSESDDAPYRGR